MTSTPDPRAPPLDGSHRLRRRGQGGGSASRLDRRQRAALDLQLAVARATALLWVPLTVAFMRFGLGWHVVDAPSARRRYREIVGDGDAPVLVCANHLTLLDSAVIAWALGSPWWYLRRFATLPWNVPERRNFASSFASRVLVYVMKCVPVVRGSDRREVAAVLDRLTYLLDRGEAVLMFPEGGRSRTGRVEIESAAYGVGRIANELPGCRVVCVYLRGEGQATYGDLPVRGERFRVHVDAIEPRPEHGGVRGSVEVSRQILARLAELERRHFGEGEAVTAGVDHPSAAAAEGAPSERRPVAMRRGGAEREPCLDRGGVAERTR
jgi:1-acyl-sn-glycerol-3-phosphate acyltransferase